MSNVVESVEVFTLEETAAFLRVSQEAVMRLVVQENLPGRQIEGQWRFLRAALGTWLSEKSGKAVLLSQAGAGDNESLPALRAAIYKSPVTRSGGEAYAPARLRHAHDATLVTRNLKHFARAVPQRRQQAGLTRSAEPWRPLCAA